MLQCIVSKYIVSYCIVGIRPVFRLLRRLGLRRQGGRLVGQDGDDDGRALEGHRQVAVAVHLQPAVAIISILTRMIIIIMIIILSGTHTKDMHARVQ